MRKRRSGFTLIELLVVMAIIATLLTLALPKYFHSVERGKETVLRHDLAVLRDALDKYAADRGHWPETLDELVERRYLRKLPPDPVTDSTATWIVVAPPDGAGHGIYDVHSGAEGNGLDGTPYQSW